MVTRKEWVFYKSQKIPKGIFRTKDKICLSPNDRGFMFADGAYEVIRTYNGKFFRLNEHLVRFKRSVDALRIDNRDIPLIETAIKELIKRNNLQSSDATIYIQVTRGVWQRSHAFPTEPVLPTVYIEASRFVPHKDDARLGIAAITVSDIRWARCDIKAIGLLPNVLARQQAVDNGAAEAIFVRDGILTEGTHTNVFGVQDGVVMTHPKTNYILAGITRDAVLGLCATNKIPFSETFILEHKLSDLEEMFLVGTTVEIMPVIKVNGKPIGKGRPGKITKALQVAFRDHILSASC
ncbi:MAG: D-amino-acid transaminase [bacterium]